MGNKRKIGGLSTIAELRKRYPDSRIASEIVLAGDKTLRLPSTSLAFTHHLGGGVKYGTIIELLGEESTGKTMEAMDLIKVAQSLGGVGLWDDAESTFDLAWAEKNGLDLSKLELLPYENQIELVSDWIADMCIYYRSILTKNEPIVLVLDSIAVLESGDALETAEMDTKAEMGRRSYLMGKLLRKRMKIFAKYGICCVFINQIRKKVGASRFEDPDTTPLAQVMKYYASQRVGLYRGKRIKTNKGKGKWVGNNIYVRTKKNKSSSPRDNIQTQVFFEEYQGNFGYSKYFGFGELLVEKGIIKRKSGTLYYKGEKICKVKEDDFSDFIQVMNTNPKLRKKLIKKFGVNTISKTREKLESIKTNLYPVKMKVKKDAKETENNE